ncbi:MAG: DHH family phosphoesterase [Spirochaetota bacterium]
MVTKKISDISACIAKHDRFTVVGHYNPDVDCVTSTLVMGLALSALGKKSVMVNADAMHKRLATIPFIDRMIFSYDVNKLETNGVLIVVDAGDINRIGTLYEYKHLFDDVIFIDHHVLRCEGGTLTYVDETASSAVELVNELFALHAPGTIRNELATLVYAGIASDTGFFCFRNTNERSLRTAADMIEAGADVEAVDGMLNRVMDENDFHLLSKLLLQVRSFDNGTIVYSVQRTENPGESYADFCVSPIDYVMRVRTVRVGFVVRETERIWRVSMRSRGGVNVRAIAESFGGGGHVKAAGCEFEKSKYDLNGIIETVTARIRAETAKLG